MQVRTVFSGVVVALSTLAFVPLGCGAMQEEATVEKMFATNNRDDDRA